MCLFDYDTTFSTKNPSDPIFDIKCMFRANIIFMVGQHYRSPEHSHAQGCTAYRKSQMQGQICTRGKRKILDQKVSGSEDQRGGGD